MESYYGPADNFSNVTFGEYTDGLRLFLDFAKYGDPSLLYPLAAIFYRKKKSFHWFKKHRVDYDGDIRVHYNPRTVETREQDLKSAPIGFVYGFYLFFASFQKSLTNAVIPWGGNELELKILFEGDGNDGRMEAAPGIGMDSVVFSIAESGQLGKFDEVRNTNLWEVLILLYNLRKKDLDEKLNQKSK